MPYSWKQARGARALEKLRKQRTRRLERSLRELMRSAGDTTPVDVRDEILRLEAEIRKAHADYALSSAGLDLAATLGAAEEISSEANELVSRFLAELEPAARDTASAEHAAALAIARFRRSSGGTADGTDPALVQTLRALAERFDEEARSLWTSVQKAAQRALSWRDKARDAADAGEDDLADAAWDRAREHLASVEELQREWSAARVLAEGVSEVVSRLA